MPRFGYGPVLTPSGWILKSKWLDLICGGVLRKNGIVGLHLTKIPLADGRPLSALGDTAHNFRNLLPLGCRLSALGKWISRIEKRAPTGRVGAPLLLRASPPGIAVR